MRLLALYHLKDQHLWHELQAQLMALKDELRLVIDDRCLSPGCLPWSEAWPQADAAVVLLSAELLADDQARLAITRCLEQGAAAGLAPVLVRARPVALPAALEERQLLPRDGKALGDVAHRALLWSQIAEGLRAQSVIRRRSGLEPSAAPAAALPQWEIRRPSDFFCGRSSELAALKGGPPIQVISGLGGSGKTQLARAYAAELSPSFLFGQELPADSPSALHGALTSVSRQLGLSDDPDAAQRLVAQWLAQHRGWLLIFENATEETSRALKELLLRASQGRVIITTRLPNGSAFGVRELALEEMTPQESVEFLRRRIPYENPSEDLERLAAELGGLPLALEQASAFIVDQQASVSDYLATWEKRGLLLLKEPAYGDYPMSVATTWSLNLEEARKASPPAGALMDVVALLGSADIPEEIFTHSGGALGPELTFDPADRLGLGAVLLPLMRHSLVEREPQTDCFRVQRLVQEVMRAALPAEQRRLWAARLVAALAQLFPAPSFTEWPRCSRLLAHALRAADWIESEGVEGAAAVTLLQRTGNYLAALGRFADAERLYLLARARCTAQGSPANEGLASVLNDLAVVTGQLGRTEESLALHQQALRLRQEVSAPPLALAESQLNLGLALKRLARLEEAERCYREALALRVQALGRRSAAVAAVLHNLGTLLRERQQWAEAEALLREALALRRELLSPADPAIARVLNSLALLLQDRAQPDLAQPLLQEALALQERALGQGHPEFARTLVNLAINARRRGAEDVALQQLERAREIMGSAMGATHPDTQRIAALMTPRPRSPAVARGAVA